MWDRAVPMLNKVPEVTLYFWIIKVLATTVGETAADYMAVDLNLGLTNITYIMGIGLGAVTGFWMAYILTRPLGASIGDRGAHP